VAYDLFRIERGAMREDLQDASAPRGPGPHRRGGRVRRLPGPGNARRTALLAGAGAVTLLALLGLATGDPFVYPPIGASAFLIFSMPEVAAAAPRNAIGGQVCGVVGGAGALAAFGLLHHHAGVADMSAPRAGAVGVSLFLATALMLLFKVSHPAAGATALMISLGIVTSPSEWLELLGAVVLLCAMGVVVNRWAGITYPLWSPPVPVLNEARARARRLQACNAWATRTIKRITKASPRMRRNQLTPCASSSYAQIVSAR
jgi:CBS domain-containing membrane protein